MMLVTEILNPENFRPNSMSSSSLIIIFVIAGLIVLTGIILSIIFKQSSIFLCCMVLLILGFMVIAVISTLAKASVNDKQVSQLQEWAEDKYMLTLNNEDSERILQYQITEEKYDDLMESQEAVMRISVEDAYENPVQVKLIDDDDEWYFVVTETKVLTSTR